MMITQKSAGLLISAVVFACALVLQGCAPSATATATTPAAATLPAATTEMPAVSNPASDLPTFTAEELSKYDGKNGSPAYVAINGTVYDVSNFPLWQGGIHQGRIQAGRDLSEEIKKSPHGVSKLDAVPVVGTYID